MTPAVRTYRFAKPSQWQQCLLHGFDVRPSSVALSARIGSQAALVGAGEAATAVVVDGDDRPTWRKSAPNAAYVVRLDAFDRRELEAEADEHLAGGARWVADRRWLWTFRLGTSNVHRYDFATLEPDLSSDVKAPILDIASDSSEGLWMLLHTGDEQFDLAHLDCRGRTDRTLPVPVDACRPRQIGTIGKGSRLAILAAEGRRLVIFDTEKASVQRLLDLENVAEGLTAARIATDARQRIALVGRSAVSQPPVLFVLDSDADTLDGPIPPRLDTSAKPAPPLVVDDIAVSAKAVWLATSRGVLKLSGEGAGAAAATGLILTPALMSPESYTDRGWLRAELDLDLPRGAVVEASFAGTSSDAIAGELTAIARDDSTSIEHRQQLIWSRLEHPAGRTFTLTGPAAANVPAAFPLFDLRDRWLWLRLRTISPPGSSPAVLRELRVLYPDASIDRYLPATFKGRENDPTGVLRRLVGVLESTTQRIDERIAGIGAHLQADTAPDDWLDYIARWLELPWDDGLAEQAKRAIVRHAGEILEDRGTRRGLETLLAALLGRSGSAIVSDVTVDHPVVPIGGGGRRGAALPLILTGASPRIATLGVKAVLGRSRIRCSRQDIDPLRTVVPTVTVRIMSEPKVLTALKPILPGILTQYVPAGISVRLRWEATVLAGVPDADGLRLDAAGPGRLGESSRLGRTLLGGAATRRITETGLDTDLPLT